jgi:hypothetical protein
LHLCTQWDSKKKGAQVKFILIYLTKYNHVVSNCDQPLKLQMHFLYRRKLKKKNQLKCYFLIVVSLRIEK